MRRLRSAQFKASVIESMKIRASVQCLHVLCLVEVPWTSEGRCRPAPANLHANTSRPALRLDDLGEHSRSGSSALGSVAPLAGTTKVLHDDKRDGAIPERCGRWCGRRR